MKKIERISQVERDLVMEVLDGGFKSKKNYCMVTQLEKEFAAKFGTKYAVAMVNGTATLHAALEAAEVREGDEVICPPLTMSSTSICVLHANATPVYADVDPATFTIDPKDIERKLTPKTKAVIPVSLYGLPCDIDPILEIAKRHNLTVIEDNAQCFLGGYKGRIAGKSAHMASYSFQASKHMTSGEGGIVTTDDADLALKLRRYSGLGYGAIGLEKGRISKDDIQSPNFERHVTLGWNYRPSDLCGAVALGQLRHLDELVEMRRICGQHFLDAVKGFDWLKPQATPADRVNSYWAFVMALDTKKVDWFAFRKKFMELGGDGVYGAWKLAYLEPMFRTQEFRGREAILARHGDYAYGPGPCPVAEDLQPRLLQFKTDYFDEAEVVRQADILHRTAEFFS